MNVPTTDEVIASIEGFLLRHAMKPTRFGRDATGEPQLLASIRSGRSPSLDTINRIADYMREKDAEVAIEAAAADHVDTDTIAVQHASPGNGDEISQQVPA